MKNVIKRGLAVVGGVAASSVAFAQTASAAVDYSAMTTAANFSDVTPVILSIAGSLAAVYVVIKGARIGLSMLRG